jgi:1-deoxy-D-xylulose-5-phosphate reductoisomerase
MAPVRVAIAGSTGSIGTQTLDVVRAEGLDRYEVVALGVGSSVDALLDQAREFRPRVVAVADEAARRRVAAELPDTEVVADQAELVSDADVVINGVVGFAGLSVTIETLRAGKRLGLANKESLIAAGPVVQPLRATPGAELVPVDSEHCAVHQCLRSSDDHREIERIVLTASGGPFRGRSADDLAAVTVAEALNHPTWSMGPKITVDSSTLMNKGLEVIEAHELFGIAYDDIDVVVHPQSVVHSMAEFTDGSTVAQLSMPDMRLPIGYALGYPHRIGTAFGRIDWTTLSRLDFEPPDRATFRCLDLAYDAGRAGGAAPAWLSAANEVAVDAFLDGLISWAQIADVCAAVLDEYDGAAPDTVHDVIAADGTARRRAQRVIEQRVMT